jgi:hypothetical protein
MHCCKGKIRLAVLEGSGFYGQSTAEAGANKLGPKGSHRYKGHNGAEVDGDEMGA